MIPFEEGEVPEDLRLRADQLEETSRKIGLYLQGFALGILPIREYGEGGAAAIFATFAVGEEAFSDRVLHPEKYDEDSEFRRLAIKADPSDIILEELRKEYEEEFKDEDDT